jgi:hypothetical protein
VREVRDPRVAGVDADEPDALELQDIVGLVALGAGIYFAVLVTISPEFRSTVTANSPISLPF